MQRLSALVVAGLVSLACCDGAFSMGGVHPPGKLGKIHSDWPDALLELINFDGRVHGHWVNANDEFFFEGDTAALEQFLSRYVKLQDTPLKLVLHSGSIRRSALWGEKPRAHYDWKLFVQRRGWGVPLDPKRPKNDPGYVVTVDVWLDGRVDLAKLGVPIQIGVESSGKTDQESSSVIDDFIAKHEARRKRAQKKNGGDPSKGDRS